MGDGLFFHYPFNFFFYLSKFLGFRLRFALEERVLGFPGGVILVQKGRAIVSIVTGFPVLQAKVFLLASLSLLRGDFLEADGVDVHGILWVGFGGSGCGSSGLDTGCRDICG